jgi:hypothetical protein
MSDYPSAEVLQKIKDFTGDYRELLELIEGEWIYPEAAWEDNGTWTFVTGGWSGHEDLIGALKENTVAWLMLWQSSRRGGRHVFSLPNAKTTGPAGADHQTTKDDVAGSGASDLLDADVIGSNNNAE